MSEETAVACPNDYDYVFRNYQHWLYGVVYRSGVPTYMVEDAAAEVLVRMLAQDGLARFDGDLAENERRTKAYLSSYFALGARAERSRVYAQENRHVPLDPMWNREQGAPEAEAVDDLAVDRADDHGDTPKHDALYERLISLSDDPDFRHIIAVADQFNTWPKTRAALLEEGWDSLRIRAGIKAVRAAVKRYLCLD